MPTPRNGKPKRAARLTEAQNALIVAEIGLAMRLGRAAARRCQASYRDGIISAALWGLCMAARRYNPKLGIPFGPYANTGIRVYIKDEIVSRMIPLGYRTIRRCEVGKERATPPTITSYGTIVDHANRPYIGPLSRRQVAKNYQANKNRKRREARASARAEADADAGGAACATGPASSNECSPSPSRRRSPRCRRSAGAGSPGCTTGSKTS